LERIDRLAAADEALGDGPTGALEYRREIKPMARFFYLGHLTWTMESEVPSRRAVKSYIKLLTGNAGPKKQQERFVDWYGDLRNSAGFQVKHKSVGGDGGIDLILESKDKFIISQLKYGEVGKDKIETFNRCIRNWDEPAKFESWLSTEVTDATCKTNYEYCFSKINDDSHKVVWEFVSLNSSDEKTFEKYEKVLRKDISKKFEARLVTAGRLNYYVMMDRLGAGPTEPLKVKIDRNTATSFERTIDGTPITTHLCVMHLDSLIDRLNDQPDPQAFFARNVRLLRTKSDVNDGIIDTFKNDHESFFFDNNGISILSTGVSFSVDTVDMNEPAIINGGQTVNSLLNIPNLNPARVLARITEIPDWAQSKDDAKKFIDNMIFRSNNNNTMFPWDLKSNDACQVEIARNLIERGVFYERKQREFELSVIHKSNVKLSIDSKRLAQNIVICDDDACGSNKGGPAYLKQIGMEPLFKDEETKTPNCYKKIFMGKLDYEQLYRQTIMYLALHDALRSTRKIRGIPRKFRKFKNASENFAYGIFWRTIRDDVGLQDLKYADEKAPKIQSVASKMVSDLFKMVKAPLVSGTVTQNDIFRNAVYWKDAKKRFLTPMWKNRVAKAVEADLRPD
jgi:AIPR protein